uniref:Uncharacterized protein n=2 Tax=Ditylum brightwellii TaxID=49249 RepID=A0A7S4QMS1_9STRA
MSGTYSCNDNQNYFVGDGRTTSRVLAEPGGKSSICLGYDDSSSNVTKPKPTIDDEPTKEADETTVVKTVEEEEEPTPTAAQTAPKSEWGGMNFGQDSDNVSNNKFASGSNMNSGNVITGRPSSRVLNPPGGKSSISLF